MVKRKSLKIERVSTTQIYYNDVEIPIFFRGDEKLGNFYIVFTSGILLVEEKLVEKI